MTITASVAQSYNPAIFRLYRQKRGWSQAETGRRAGRNQDYVSRLETGKKRATLDDINRMAPVYGVKPATLARALFGAADTPITTD